MSLYRQKGSTHWWISLSHPDQPRVRRSAGTADRTEAQRTHDELKAQLWSQAPITGRTWGQAVVLWASDEHRSQSDILSMAKFGKHFKDRQLHRVTAEGLDKALGFCETASTYMRYRARIMAILNRAVEAKWLREAPRMPTRRVKAKPRKWITREQWGKLYVVLAPHQRPMAEFAMETGLRQENVLGLTWARVDLDRAMVWVEAEDAKAEKAIHVPLNEVALAVLKALRKTAAEDAVWVFTFRGKPIKEIKTAWAKACRLAGVPGFTWHGMRHSWATWHAQNGTPLDVLQKLGAWSDPRMVQNYAHHAPTYLSGFAGNTRKK